MSDKSTAEKGLGKPEEESISFIYLLLVSYFILGPISALIVCAGKHGNGNITDEDYVIEKVSQTFNERALRGIIHYLGWLLAIN